jgi:hypothetical protein
MQLKRKVKHIVVVHENKGIIRSINKAKTSPELLSSLDSDKKHRRQKFAGY